MTRLGSGRAATALAGLLFIVLVLGLSVVGVAYGFGAFSSSKVVTATLPEAGPALGPGAEVEYRGVLVGSVASVHRTLSDAVLTLHVDPSQLSKIPDGVTVRLVPRSVFGDLYVDLVPPATSDRALPADAHLVADTSTPTVELDQALDAGYRLLTAVRPGKLDATLTAIATALNGRGAELGAIVDELERYTRQVAPQTPQLIHDVATLGTVSDELGRDAPNLLKTLDNAIATSQTVHGSQAAIRRLLAAGPVVADRTRRLLRVNQHKLRELVGLLRPVITVLQSRQTNLVKGVTQLRAFLLGAAKALGHGPWLQVTVAPDLNPQDTQGYTPAECPRYAAVPGKNCLSTKAHAERNATSARQVGKPRAISWPELVVVPILALLSLLVSP
ncbi:MAG TPA: MlaD family protein [Mycobacteriales bacterium]|nr:MlaD family protein [Mycobacteriales bacterium]